MADYCDMIYSIDGSLFHKLYTSYDVPRNVKKRYKNLHEQFYALLKKKNNTYFNLGEYATLYIEEFKNLYYQFVEFDKVVERLNLVERVITII